MNVACFVNPDYGGGIARHSCEMVTGLARRSDIAVEVLASRKSLKRNPHVTQAFRGLPLRALPFSNVTIERIWKAFGWPHVDRYVSDRCDLVYAPAHARLPSSRLPTVMTIHDVQAFEPDLPWSQTPEHRRFHRKWQTWLPRAARETTRIITVSEFSKRRIVELVGVAAERIGVVGNGVSHVFFQAGTTCQATRRPSIVVVGGLRTKKGAGDTLAVARLLEERRSPLRIDVVGENDAEWAEASEANANVTLHGMMTDDSLAKLLACASALLFLSPYEGFGIPALEAMATGTPAVVANRAALPEVVGDAGLIVDPADHKKIAELLEQLYEDAEWRLSHVEAGLAHAAHYRWDACVDRLAIQLQKASSRLA
jgi:glycosyltransferase involved in cell wall biosynthesis